MTATDKTQVPVKRRYIPKPEWKTATSINGLTDLQIRALPNFPYVLAVNVDPTKPYRRVWAWLLRFPGAGTWQAQFDLVCSLNGEEMYRQQLANTSNALSTTAGQFFTNVADQVATFGMMMDGVLTYVNATPYIIIPWQINVTCDTMYIEIKRINSSLAFNGNLFVQSQVGI